MRCAHCGNEVEMHESGLCDSCETQAHYDKEAEVGKRIRLVRCTDEYTRLTPGDEGTVTHVDDLGTVSVKWDSGSRLGLVPGEDQWEVID